HVHGRRHNPELYKSCPVNNASKSAAEGIWTHETARNVSPALRLVLLNQKVVRPRNVLHTEPRWRIRQLSGRHALACQAELPHRLDPLQRLRHLLQLIRCTFTQPQAPALPAVDELVGLEPSPEPLGRRGL